MNKKLLHEITSTFSTYFGNTPLRERNEDIYKEALELSRFTTIQNLKEEHGDLLSTLLMSFAENGWDPEECVRRTLEKIKNRHFQYKAYGRKFSVAIIGGAFSPPTMGHIAIAEFLLNFSSMFDFVYLMPCHKHMYNKVMPDAGHRLQMLKLATQHDRRISVFDYEIKNEFGGETYNLVKHLLSDDSYENFQFSFVIGMDNANTFDKWVNFQDLERMMRFIVIPRTGIDQVLKSSWYLNAPHMLLIPEKPLLEISSTDLREELNRYWHGETDEIRQLAISHLSDPKFIHPEVFEYIKENKLYR
jgi:nicotinate-nucleotide adenylyltransferase